MAMTSTAVGFFSIKIKFCLANMVHYLRLRAEGSVPKLFFAIHPCPVMTATIFNKNSR